MPTPDRPQIDLDIARSVENRMRVIGMDDTWDNRIAFYSGMLFGWTSEPSVHDAAYNRALQRLIDEAKQLRDATNTLLQN